MRDDPEKNFVSYPNKKFKSYNDCDEDFVARALPPSLISIWTTDNVSPVTKQMFLPVFPSNKYDYSDLFDGAQRSSCPLYPAQYTVLNQDCWMMKLPQETSPSSTSLYPTCQGHHPLCNQVHLCMDWELFSWRKILLNGFLTLLEGVNGTNQMEF